MEVRRAAKEDLVAIHRVAHAAVWDSFAGLLKPSTITALLEREFSPSNLRRRMLAGRVVVATRPDRGVVGFADASLGEDRVELAALSTLPEERRRGVATAMMREIRTMAEGRPVCADVLLGNLDGERFLEAAGFVPGEVIHRHLLDEEVVERRWWHSRRG
jgi:GNAT superfamily N-acetyltransferase